MLLVFVIEGPPAGTFEILVLTIFEGPQERREAEAAKSQRCRDEPGECGHDRGSRFSCASLSALAVTAIEDADIAIAAMSGVTSPAMAIGTNSTL